MKEDRKEKEEREDKFSREEIERNHKLAKLKFARNRDYVNLGPSSEDNLQSVSISLKFLMRLFDPEKSKIRLFLALFEKQAKKVKVP